MWKRACCDKLELASLERTRLCAFIDIGSEATRDPGQLATQGGDAPTETMAGIDAMKEVPGWNGLEESWNQYLVEVECVSGQFRRKSEL